MDKFKNMIVKVLKPAIMKKHKLEELFDEVDKLKEQLETNKHKYQELLNELFKDFDNDGENEDNISNEVDSDEEEPEINKVSYKDVEYILEDNIMYKIKKDGSRGSKVGTWNDGKVKKGIKKEKTIDA